MSDVSDQRRLIDVIASGDRAMYGSLSAGELFDTQAHSLTSAEKTGRLAAGGVLFAPADWPISSSGTVTVVNRFASIWDQFSIGSLSEGIRRIVGWIRLDPVDWVKGILTGSSTDQTPKTSDCQHWNLVQLLIARPYLRLAASILTADIDLNVWGRGFCPGCGHSPALSLLYGDIRARFLWCQWCETRWAFPRIRCPFCENTDHQSVRHYETDPPSNVRVDVCDNCRGYVKTLSATASTSINDLELFRFELSCSDLDEAAAVRGYHRVHRVGKGAMQQA